MRLYTLLLPTVQSVFTSKLEYRFIYKANSTPIQNETLENSTVESVLPGLTHKSVSFFLSLSDIYLLESY